MNDKAKLLNGKGNLVVTGNQTKGSLLYLDLAEISCFLGQVDENWLWHKSLCHVNFDNLINIRKKKE